MPPPNPPPASSSAPRHPPGLLRGCGQAPFAIALGVSLNRALHDRTRLLFSAAYGVGFGLIGLQWTRWYISFPQAFLIAAGIDLISTAPWRILLDGSNPRSFGRILFLNGALAWAVGIALFLLSLFLPVAAFAGLDKALLSLRYYAPHGIFWALLFPIVGFGIAIGEDYERMGRRQAARMRRMARLAEQARVGRPSAPRSIRTFSSTPSTPSSAPHSHTTHRGRAGGRASGRGAPARLYVRAAAHRHSRKRTRNRGRLFGNRAPAHGRAAECPA